MFDHFVSPSYRHPSVCLMRITLGVIFLTHLLIAKCATPTETSDLTSALQRLEAGEYFTPIDGDLFNRWRVERLGRIPLLFNQTDSTKFSRQEIETTLWPAFLPRELPQTLNSTVVDERMREPVRRAIYALVVLSDLDMACTPSPMNPWNVVTELQKSANGDIDDHTLALTFVMIVPTCTTVWASMKAIANQHNVNVVQLTHHVAQIGAVEGTKWFIRILRPNNGRSSSRGGPSTRPQSV